MAKSSLPSRAPMPISTAFVIIHIRLTSARVQKQQQQPTTAGRFDVAVGGPVAITPSLRGRGVRQCLYRSVQGSVVVVVVEWLIVRQFHSVKCVFATSTKVTFLSKTLTLQNSAYCCWFSSGKSHISDSSPCQVGRS